MIHDQEIGAGLHDSTIRLRDLFEKAKEYKMPDHHIHAADRCDNALQYSEMKTGVC